MHYQTHSIKSLVNLSIQELNKCFLIYQTGPHYFSFLFFFCFFFFFLVFCTMRNYFISISKLVVPFSLFYTFLIRKILSTLLICFKHSFITGIINFSITPFFFFWFLIYIFFVQIIVVYPRSVFNGHFWVVNFSSIIAAPKRDQSYLLLITEHCISSWFI